MVESVDPLESILGKELFPKEVEVIKTDRGSEFSDAEGLEKDNDGRMRTYVFYCDSMASCQKGSLENNHKEIRYGSLTVVSNFLLTKSLKTLIISMLLSFFIVKFVKL